MTLYGTYNSQLDAGFGGAHALAPDHASAGCHVDADVTGLSTDCSDGMSTWRNDTVKSDLEGGMGGLLGTEGGLELMHLGAGCRQLSAMESVPMAGWEVL